MSLRVASSIASSALRTSEVGIAVASSNVANADTDGYTRKTASNVTRSTGVNVASVDVTAVSSNVDRYLLKTLVSAQSDLGYTDTRNSYLDQMQSAFGSVSSDDSGGTDIGSMIDALADTLGTLATSPESESAKAATVQDLSDLAETLRSTSSSIQSLRAQADDEIATTVDSINESLNSIDSLNDQIVKGKALGQNVTDLEDQRNTALKSLAKNIDVTYQVDDSGLMRISTASGKALLDTKVHELSYTPAASVSASTVYSASGSSGFNGIMLNGVDVTGSSLGGTLGALVQLRDTDLPAQQAGLDELATTLMDTLNTIQNQGTSYPAPQSLTGTEAVSATDALKVTSGTLRVAVTDSSGTAAEVLDIDLSTKSTLQDVVDAINTMSNATASISSDGKLVISANSASNGIALGGDANDGTTGAFSDTYGMNDLLTGTGASDIKVATRISDDSSLLATGALSSTSGLTAGDTVLTSGEGSVAKALSAAFSASYDFDAAGSLSARSTTFSGYAGAVIQGAATLADKASTAYDSQNTYTSSLESTFSSQSGVNVDEETAAISTLQSAYEAAAAVMKTLQEMFSTALDMVQ
ncbi:flagellar hook-associated protein 1 FlgK [Azospirillum lipoferum]|uniref:Flagellar hook-associated protein 1 n=1 Tax=Azospirillum lipoferum TaxID=193 RepID=A0A5A9GJF8_AZOLI|nr:MULTISPECIES: flagellar hook-associated protein FlgK [Azospirillum]KAA0594506.1 flagellar hook-associated protein FlgK [Azospirillum lipoferum]MCP1613260.1 flagellar hook-associated protein 1 FlgK [Azospirillum lipoferum]MDW5531459.1 flagellar hook-associated protein FlgK [Azospirillum sp. NL1]